MGQRGITLIEVVCALALIGIAMAVVIPSTRMLESIVFSQRVDQIHAGVIHARQMARTTNNTHRIIKINPTQGEKKNEIMIYGMGASPMREIYELPTHIEIKIGNQEMTSEYDIEFEGDNSSLRAGTITLKNYRLGKQVQIRVRPVTGKTAIYTTDLRKGE
ncbi:MAG: pilus assembly FimT family protein [Cellulosilyticaceae bacterium]